MWAHIACLTCDGPMQLTNSFTHTYIYMFSQQRLQCTNTGIPIPPMTPACAHMYKNNEYLERLTCTGPKCLHILYKHCQNFSAYNRNAHTHAWTHTLAHARARAHTHIHTPAAYQGNETKEKVCQKRKVFKKDLKALTQVAWWWTETGSWFLATGAWQALRVERQYSEHSLNPEVHNG